MLEITVKYTSRWFKCTPAQTNFSVPNKKKWYQGVIIDVSDDAIDNVINDRDSSSTDYGVILLKLKNDKEMIKWNECVETLEE